MFHSAPTGPLPAWKKTVYLLSTVVLWLLFGALLQLVIAFSFDRLEQLASFSFLTWWRLAVLVGFGVAGWFIGQMWWRWIYVEHRWTFGKDHQPHG